MQVGKRILKQTSVCALLYALGMRFIHVRNNEQRYTEFSPRKENTRGPENKKFQKGIQYSA
jgi:hypothetical protein